MNVAYCFSGQVRTFKDNFESFQKHVLSPNSSHNHYLFACCTKDEDSAILKKYNFTSILEINPEDEDFDERPYLHRTFCKHSNWNKERPEKVLLKSLYKKKRCFELVPEGKFDWVFRVRFDAFFVEDVENLSTLSNEYLYLPNYGHYNGYNDRFAFSSYENMKIYFSQFDLLDEFMQTSLPFHPETILRYTLDSRNIKIKFSSCKHGLNRFGDILKDYEEIPHFPL